ELPRRCRGPRVIGFRDGLLITIFIGVWGFRILQKTAVDYFLASRNIGLMVLIFAYTMAVLSGWTFLGVPGYGYRMGIAFGSAYGVFGLFAIFVFLAL
ncbi:MAG: hypothetical protein ACUVTQ_09140, partial [Desulfotomaculales bacterium]